MNEPDIKRPAISLPGLSAELAELLEARRAEALADPEAGSDWEAVKSRLRRKTRRSPS